MKKHIFVSVAGALVLASNVAAGSSKPDQRLADALVVQKADGPKYWLEWKVRGGAPFSCAAKLSTGTAQSRSVVGGPNTSVNSLATVFRDRRRAHRYYLDALTTLPGCARSLLAAEHSTYVWDAQPLTVGRFGIQSGAWRLRYLDRGNQRKSVDWALVDTGRAVVIDVFSIAWYDEHWRDTGFSGALGGSGRAVERRILTNETRRAANAAAN